MEYISFSKHATQEFIRLAPKGTPVYYLNGDATPQELKEWGCAGPDYHFSVFQKHPEWIGQCHDLGMKVNAWTVNDAKDMQWLIDHKVDFITTNEPVLLHKFVVEGVGLHPDKIDPLKLAALELGSASSQEALETYWKTFAAEAKKAVPEMAEQLDFTVKTRNNYVERWTKAYAGKKVPGAVKRKMCSFLEKVLPDVMRNDSMGNRLVAAYADQLLLWNDPKYQERGVLFLKSLLNQNTVDPNKLFAVRDSGAKLAEQLGNKKYIAFFRQSQTL